MQINNLPSSAITEPKPSATANIAPPPLKQTPAAKPAAAPAPKPTDTVSSNSNTESKVKAEITDVKPTGDTNAEGDPTFTLKVNGKEYKATQSEIIALAQKAKGAEAAMKQKAEIEKLTSDLLDNFDKDTFGLMERRHGKEKAKAMAIAMVKRLIDDENKDPRDLAIEEKDAKLKRFEEAEAFAKKQKEDSERQAKQQVLYKDLLTSIDTELNATHLPKDKLTLTRVLNYLAAGKKANGVNWTVKEAVQAVEVEDMGHASYYAKQYVDGKLPSEKFRSIFGEEAFKKLNKEQINLLKNADKIVKHNAAPAESGEEEGEPVARKPRTLSKNRGTEAMSEREYRRKHGSLGGI